MRPNKKNIMSICEQVQGRLAEEGPTILDREAELRDHCVHCPHCSAFHQKLVRMEQAAAKVPMPSVSEVLIAQTLRAVDQASKVTGALHTMAHHRRRGWIAFSFGLLIPLTLALVFTISVYQPLLRLGTAVMDDSNGPTTELEVNRYGMEDRRQWIADIESKLESRAVLPSESTPVDPSSTKYDWQDEDDHFSVNIGTRSDDANREISTPTVDESFISYGRGRASDERLFPSAPPPAPSHNSHLAMGSLADLSRVEESLAIESTRNLPESKTEMPLLSKEQGQAQSDLLLGQMGGYQKKAGADLDVSDRNGKSDAISFHAYSNLANKRTVDNLQAKVMNEIPSKQYQRQISSQKVGEERSKWHYARGVHRPTSLPSPMETNTRMKDTTRRAPTTLDGLSDTAPNKIYRWVDHSEQAIGFSRQHNATKPKAELEEEAMEESVVLFATPTVTTTPPSAILETFDLPQSGVKTENSKPAFATLEPTVVIRDSISSSTPRVGHKKQADLLGEKKNAKRKTKRSSINILATRTAAQTFLAQRRSLDRLSFQPAVGYWANTYIPGDPAIRMLEARLDHRDRAMLGTKVTLGLEQTAQQTWQPFDAPQTAALAVYLYADRAALTERSRMLVQVGIKGSYRQSGLRPAMNVCLVLDLRQNIAPYGGALRALLNALQAARQPDDRFCLVVAGRSGGTLIPSGHYQYGSVQVAIRHLFTETDQQQAKSEVRLDLVEAVKTAMANVRREDNPTATLGASLVLLVSSANLNNELPRLEPLVHQNAVDGIHLSVVSLAGTGDLKTLDRLVQAGQGNRRVLHGAAEATNLIDHELHSASRSVARAVRLRIRLTPGVRLIEILGSHRLEAPQAQRVREAEQSIDRRLARNLGIRADRGKDEEGIQIVIPNFYAGDAHVVLLDVVAPGPGPIADVTVRYKDLVYLGNGIARARLQLPFGQVEPGPLAHNVVKNLLAWKMAQTARWTGMYLSAQHVLQARNELRTMQQLVAGMRLEVAGWSQDDELIEDERLLQAYLDLLQKLNLQTTESVSYLADSLRLLAFRRLLPVREKE